MKNSEGKRKYLEIYRSKPENKLRHLEAATRYRIKKRNGVPLRPKGDGTPWKEKMRSRRIKVLEHYGAECVCCGETEKKFLALDHKNGGGNKHRKQIGTGDICAWIVKNNFPAIFQILCHNCNSAKGYYGSCPHQKESAVFGSAQN